MRNLLGNAGKNRDKVKGFSNEIIAVFEHVRHSSFRHKISLWSSREVVYILFDKT